MNHGACVVLCQKPYCQHSDIRNCSFFLFRFTYWVFSTRFDTHIGATLAMFKHLFTYFQTDPLLFHILKYSDRRVPPVFILMIFFRRGIVNMICLNDFRTRFEEFSTHLNP